jgi:hypothetical protein
MLAGSTPFGRQALLAYLAAQSGLAAELQFFIAGKAGKTADSAAAGARSLFSSWVAAGNNRLLYADTLLFTEADVENLAGGPGAGLALLESYRMAFSRRGASQRTFAALPVALGPGKDALVGTILSAWLTGPKRGLVPAEGFLASLLKPETQKALSIATGLMPTNFQAPVLEGANTAILALALRAEAVLGVNPEPADEPSVKILDDALAAMRNDPGNWASHIPVR